MPVWLGQDPHQSPFITPICYPLEKIIRNTLNCREIQLFGVRHLLIIQAREKLRAPPSTTTNPDISKGPAGH